MFSSANDLMLQTVNNLDSVYTVYLYSIPISVCMYSIITHARTVESEVQLSGLMYACAGFYSSVLKQTSSPSRST